MHEDQRALILGRCLMRPVRMQPDTLYSARVTFLVAVHSRSGVEWQTSEDDSSASSLLKIGKADHL